MADRLAAEVWRTCIDWALLTQTPAQPRPVAQARRLVERIARAIYPDGDWQRIGGGRLAPDAIGLATVRDELRQLLGQLDLADVQAALRAQMAVALSGAAPPWTARLDACFAEMIEATSTSFRMLDAQLEVMLGLPATPPASVEQTIQTGRGIGIAPTARGELCYEFDINGGQIQTCRMSAPTDRVFGSDGPVVQLLQQLLHANDPLLAVRWVLAAYDPCLEVQVNAVGA